MLRLTRFHPSGAQSPAKVRYTPSTKNLLTPKTGLRSFHNESARAYYPPSAFTYNGRSNRPVTSVLGKFWAELREWTMGKILLWRLVVPF